jgi:hypothetical protein
MENAKQCHQIIIRINQCNGKVSEVVHNTENEGTLQDAMNVILSDIGYHAEFQPLKRKGGGGTLKSEKSTPDFCICGYVDTRPVVVRDANGGYYVVCKSPTCSNMSRINDTEQEAIEDWDAIMKSER